MKIVEPEPLVGYIQGMATPSFSDLRALSISERLLLAQDLWDSVVQEDPEAVPMTDAQRQELDHRLTAYHRSPGEGRSWEQVKERIRKPS
jgi:putative addiction module component (TIGR02574 family)